MIGLRAIGLIVLTVVLGTAPVSAGEKKPWKAETKPEATGEAPSYCGSLAALIRKRLAKLQAIQAAVKNHETASSSSVLEFTERMMGNSYQTDWEREQLATLAKGKAEAVELNERDRGQGCGSIDIEQELARPTPPTYTPLKSQEKKTKIK